MVTGQAYAGFLQALGHRVVQTPTAHWYDASRWVAMSAPPNRVYAPAPDELRSVMRGLACIGVRFAAPLPGPGTPSYQIVCDNPNYGFETLSANVRSKVRRGLKRCRVEAVSCAVAATAGRQAHADTVGRQRRVGGLDGLRWERFWSAAAATPGIEVWGAWCDEDLAAFLVSVTFEDCVEFLLARSRSEHLGAYPNNALLFTVTEEMLGRRRVGRITFGLESLEAVGPLDQFKFGMGFRAEPLCQRVVLHPLVRTALRAAPVRGAFGRWAKRREDSVFWRKAAGLLRFAEDGGS